MKTTDNNMRLTDSQIRDFIKEYMYKEISYLDIEISTRNGLIVIEYKGGFIPNINTVTVDTHDISNLIILYDKVKEAFNSLINKLSAEGITIKVDARKLIENAKKAIQISNDRKIIDSFNEKINVLCKDILRDHNIKFKINRGVILINYSDVIYEWPILNFEVIHDSRYHDEILEDTYRGITSILDIIMN